jgi:hypothetical protein
VEEAAESVHAGWVDLTGLDLFGDIWASASLKARSASWSTTGPTGEDDDTSATPETIFWRKHRKIIRSRARLTTPALSVPNTDNISSRNNAGAVALHLHST